MRDAWLSDSKIDGMFVAAFWECDSNTASNRTSCYASEHEALMKIDLFKNADIYQKLARR
ncbi:hypothetical protein KKH23_06855 [Patescibacteria group bacterium]|uniref:Uncharacterized protein n=1 Tax=viral metagenome TaxID=1070528 RepID=A0A6M3LSP0_9ZZZZ|nr:hypothetical protein [Patescibacteria group bacterium]